MSRWRSIDPRLAEGKLRAEGDERRVGGGERDGGKEEALLR